jgi:hypothetical protein
MKQQSALPPDLLNTIGLDIIRFDIRYVGLLIVCAYLLLCVLLRIRHRLWPEAVDSAHLFISLIGMYAGLICGSVFLFTQPPAVAELTPDSRMLIGLVFTTVMVHVGIAEIRAILRQNQAISHN